MVTTPSEEQLTAVIQRLVGASDGLDLVLVGGLATAAWANIYGLAPVNTKDLDWVGSPTSARAYAKKVGGTLHENPRLDPNLAVVEVSCEGRIERVDFLSSILGVQTSSLRKRAREIEFASTKVRIMHPVHLVRSRCVNLVHPDRASSRKADRFQATIAVQVCERFMHDTSREAHEVSSNVRHHHVRKMAEDLLDFSAKVEARRCWQEQGIDPFDAVQPWPEMDEDFRERGYARMRERANRGLGKKP